MATLPKSQIDPGLPLQDPAMLAWLRQYGLGVPQAGNTSPIMERLMQTTADPPAGLGDLPSRFYAPGYIPRRSAPSRIDYNPMGFPEEASLQGGEGTDTLAGGKRTIAGTAAQRGLSTVDPRLVQIIDAAAARSPYDVQIFSGQRPGPKGGSRHNSGNALDIALIDPATGQVIPNYKSSTGFPIYAEFAKIAREEQMAIAPEMADQFRWGGGFSDKDFDLMHFDFKPGGAMAYWTWKDGGKLTAAGAAAVPKFGPGYIYANGERVKAPPGQYASLWGRGPLQEQPAAVAIQETPVSPEQVAAIQASAATAADAAWGPQQTAALALDGMDDAPPAQQAAAEMASGTSTDTLTGGITPPTPRIRDQDVLNQNIADQLDEAMFGAGPHRGEYARGRPEGRWVEGAGGAPDASAVPMPNINPQTLASAPAVGGPNDRRPQPPMPSMRPEGRFVAGAGGAPDAVVVPNPTPRGTPYAPSFPSLFGEQPAPLMGGMSAAMGGPPSRSGDLSAAMGDAPMTDERRQQILSDLDAVRQRRAQPAPAFPSLYGEQPSAAQPAATVYADAIDRFDTEAPAAPALEIPSEINPALEIASRSPWQQERASRYLANDEMRKRTRMEDALGGAQPQAQPPPGPPLDPMDIFGGVDRTGTMMRAPEARTKDDFYSPPPLDFSLASEPAPVLMAAPSSPTGPIGNTISPDNDRGSGRQPFIDANRTPISVDYSEPAWLDLPDPTPPSYTPATDGWAGREEFDQAHSPGGPAVITENPAYLNRQRLNDQFNIAFSPDEETGQDAINQLVGVGGEMGAIPFNDVTRGIGSPDFSNASDASWWNGAPTTGDLGLGAVPPKNEAMADVLDDAPNPGEALAEQAITRAYEPGGMSAVPESMRPESYAYYASQPDPNDATGGLNIRSNAQLGLPEETPAPAATGSAPIFAQPPSPAGGRLGPIPGSGPFGALFGGAGGGLMGKIGANWAGPQWTGAVTQGSGPYMYDSGMGTNDWWSGDTNAMGGSTGLSWTGSDGRTVTAYSNDGGRTYTHGYGPGA